MHGVLCEAHGSERICAFWRATHAACRLTNVQVVQRAIRVRDAKHSLLLQVQYTAWVLRLAPIDMHLHVVLTMDNRSGHVERHEEQLLVGKMVAQVPILGRLWWWSVHVLTPLLLHTLWLPVVRMAVADSKAV